MKTEDPFSLHLLPYALLALLAGLVLTGWARSCAAGRTQGAVAAVAASESGHAASDSARAARLSFQNDSLLAMARRADTLLARADSLLGLQADSTARARQEAAFAEMRRKAEGNALSAWFLMLENGQHEIRESVDSVGMLVDSVRTESRRLAERNLRLSMQMADSARMVRAALAGVRAEMSRRPAYADSLLRAVGAGEYAPPKKNRRPKPVRHKARRPKKKPNPDG